MLWETINLKLLSCEDFPVSENLVTALPLTVTKYWYWKLLPERKYHHIRGNASYLSIMTSFRAFLLSLSVVQSIVLSSCPISEAEEEAQCAVHLFRIQEEPLLCIISRARACNPGGSVWGWMSHQVRFFPLQIISTSIFFFSVLLGCKSTYNMQYTEPCI